MQKEGKEKYSFHSDFREYLVAIIVIAVTAGICFPLNHIIGYHSVGLILLMAVAILSLFLGRWPLLLAAVLNVVIWDYLFQEPRFSFLNSTPQDYFANLADLLVGIVAVILITRIRKSREVLRQSQERITILFNFLESMNDATSLSGIIEVACNGLKDNFGQEPVIYLKDKKGDMLSPVPYGNSVIHNNSGYVKSSELFKESQKGSFTDLLKSFGGITYYALRDSGGVIGIIGMPEITGISEDAVRTVFIKSFFTLIASTLGREFLVEMARDKDISDKSEKLFHAILNSVSHELRTPISIITTAVENLKDSRTSSEPEKRKEICDELGFASIRLNKLVENILDMSRIESGMLKLNLEICDISDIIGIVVKDLNSEMHEHHLNIRIPEDISLVRADISLIRQALINILRNAIIYTPHDTGVDIIASNCREGMVMITVRDHGKGVPPESLEFLFDKFYRVPGSVSGGTGLGLAIAKAFIEAHGGKIDARNHPEGGLSVSIYLKTGEYHGKKQE